MKQQSSKRASSAVPPERQARTTVILTETLNFNLDLLALRSRRAKGELIREALAEYVKKQGLVPESVPSIEISYRETENVG